MATEKKTEAAKPAVKKALAKKPAPKKDAVAVSATLQYGGTDFAVRDVEARAVEAAKAQDAAVGSVDVYLKPEDGMAYYVGHGKDGDVSGSVALQA